MHHREITLAQGVVRYREFGDGPPIVFVHGLLADGQLWDGVVQHLGGRFRCVLPDWPLGAHRIAMSRRADLSPRGVAKLVADFLAALELDDVTLVGNDTGGAICQLVATEHPARIGRLVLTDCDAFQNFLPPLLRYLQASAWIPGTVTVLMQSMRVPIARRLPIAFGWLAKHSIDRRLLAGWVEPVLADRWVRRDLGKVLRGIRRRDLLAAAERLHRFDRPALIAWSPEDRLFPFEHAERLAAILPDSRLEAIDDAWTFVALDQPARLARALADFVDETGGRAEGRRPAGVGPAAGGP